MIQDAFFFKSDARCLRTSDLLAAESWLWEQVQEKKVPKVHIQRLRMWCIFMLLRYAGLRVVEVMALQNTALDFTNALVCIEGKRQIPLPKVIARRLHNVWLESGFFSMEYPLRCDQSLVRRTFQQCAKICCLPKGLLTARSLRWNRALELLKQGLPIALIDIFLGRNTNASGKIDIEKAQAKLCEYIHAGTSMKTSARNVFQGRIEKLEKNGLLVKVSIRTAGGLRIVALITDTSYTSLKLAEGVLVNASIKAPWVILLSDQMPLQSGENSFSGVIDQVRSDATLSEILVTLPEGSQVCCLCEKALWEKGQAVTVFFTAFSVIVSLD